MAHPIYDTAHILLGVLVALGIVGFMLAWSIVLCLLTDLARKGK